MKKSINDISGFTLTEMLVAISLMSILMAIGVYNMRNLNRPLTTTSAEVSALFKQARAKAIGTTSAYFVTAANDEQIVTSQGTNCADGTPTLDAALSLDLPLGVRMTNTAWQVCFSAKGISDSNVVVELKSPENELSEVEVFLGGAIRING